MEDLLTHLPMHGRTSLLDRLTGRRAHQPVGEEQSSGRGNQTAGDDAYPDSVMRDIEWLFNAAAPLGLSDSELQRKYPRAATSVLCYGLRGILGRVVHDLAEIEKQVASALQAFEPRLIVEEMSLQVSQEGQLVEIEIKGLLLTRQVKRQLWIRTDLNTLNSRLKSDADG